MAFMKRDVNIGLLILIIATIILFSGFSVYYQTTFKDITLEYNTKLDQLGKVTSELSVQKLALNETYSLRKKAEEDRKVLDVRYRDVSDENERVIADNTNLRSEVINTKSQLAEKSSELDSTKILLAQTQNVLGTIRSERDALKIRKGNLEDDIDRLCGKLAEGETDSAC